MTQSALLQYRLHNQQISQHAFQQPSEVLAWLGALQGQDYAGAKWSIGLRLPHSSDAAIEQAIADRTIIRTWALRGTLHFVAPEDIYWLLELLKPRLHSLYASYYRKLGLDKAVLKKSHAIMVQALQGGQQLTRKELAAALQKKGIATHDMRLSFLLLRAAVDGLICFGCRRGKELTHTLLQEWAPATPAIGRQEALAKLTDRYFRSHGPATLADFVWWSGLTMADAKAGIEMVKSDFEQIVLEKQSYWLRRDMPAVKRSTAVYLLPGFDEYMLGYANRSAALEPKYSKQVAGANGLFNATIVINGRVTGTWKRTFKKNSLIVETWPFEPISEAYQKAIVAAVGRYRRFTGLNGA